MVFRPAAAIVSGIARSPRAQLGRLNHWFSASFKVWQELDQRPLSHPTAMHQHKCQAEIAKVAWCIPCWKWSCN